MCPPWNPSVYFLSTNWYITPGMDIPPMYITSHAGTSKRPPCEHLSFCEWQSPVTDSEILLCHLTTSIPTRIFPWTSPEFYWKISDSFWRKCVNHCIWLMVKFFGYRDRLFFIHVPRSSYAGFHLEWMYSHFFLSTQVGYSEHSCPMRKNR